MSLVGRKCGDRALLTVVSCIDDLFKVSMSVKSPTKSIDQQMTEYDLQQDTQPLNRLETICSPNSSRNQRFLGSPEEVASGMAVHSSQFLCPIDPTIWDIIQIDFKEACGLWFVFSTILIEIVQMSWPKGACPPKITYQSFERPNRRRIFIVTC